jgi:PAS domain S-box-containing protein
MLQAILEYRLDLLLFAALAVGGMASVHLWLRRAPGAAGVGPAAWCGLAALLVGGAVVTDTNADRARDRLRTTLQSFARTYAEELQRMGHARLTWDVAGNDPLYLSMIEAEKRWLRANPYAADIYTFRRNPQGRVAFLVDSETDYNHDGRIEGDRESRTPVGEVFPQADGNMEAALAGRVVFDDIPVTDRWGSWVSAYVPLYDDNGRVEGAVGVDYDAASWSTLVLTHRGMVLGAAAALVGVLLASTAINGALRAEVDRRRRAERALASSEERSRLIIESALDAVVTIDAAGRITGWNRTAEAIFGWPRGEALGRPLADTILPARFREGHYRRLAGKSDAFAADATGTRMELQALRRNGEEFPLELSITRLPPSASGAGHADAYSGFMRDITRRKAAEAAVRQSEERFRVAATCASDSICEWDLATGRLSWFGETGERLGYRLGQFPDTLDAWREMVHPDDRARVAEALDRHITAGAPFREEYRVIGAAGEVRHWAGRGAAIRDADGNARVMVAVVSDVTRERHAQALEAEQSALRKAVASMEQVLGIVAHELRTPLAGVRAMSEYLLDGADRQAAEFDHFLRGMNLEVVRMAETVNNLLEAARINSGRAKWNFSAFDARDACREAAERVRPVVSAAVELACDLPGQALPMTGDAEAVVRLVLNLLSNAAKHTHAGSVTVSARAVEEAQARWVEFCVADTGDGIPPDIVDRLGEAFALNAGIVGDKHVKGTGLGLAICRGIVAAHGGSLSFDSQVGRGTRATVRLRADLSAPVSEHTSPSVVTDEGPGARARRPSPETAAAI